MIDYEEMSLDAWPALRTSYHRGCILRFSNGYTNRANSANPLYSDKADFPDIVRHAERFYNRHGIPCVFKILETERYSSLDRLLEAAGYEAITRTSVLLCDLGNFDGTALEPIETASVFSDEWFSSFIEFNRISKEHAITARQMLALIPVETVVACIRDNGAIVACGYGAIEGEHVGFFDIVVKGECRGKGYGRRLMNGIIAEAKKHGARKGYLQVMENNDVARNLYAGLGFRELYRYWYRKKTEGAIGK